MGTGLVRGLRDQIVDRLRAEVLSGNLPAGTPLKEVELSSRFGVSRGPIREALQQLTFEGALTGLPNRGVQVAPAPPEGVRDLIIPIRRAVETFALRHYFDKINSHDFEIWDGILRRLKFACEQSNYIEIAEQDIALHRFIVSRSEQNDLLAIWSVLVSRIWTHFRENHPKYDNAMDIYQEHVDLINAFRGADVETAVDALSAHIESEKPADKKLSKGKSAKGKSS